MCHCEVRRGYGGLQPHGLLFLLSSCSGAWLRGVNENDLWHGCL